VILRQDRQAQSVKVIKPSSCVTQQPGLDRNEESSSHKPFLFCAASNSCVPNMSTGLTSTLVSDTASCTLLYAAAHTSCYFLFFVGQTGIDTIQWWHCRRCGHAHCINPLLTRFMHPSSACGCHMLEFSQLSGCPVNNNSA
jgi:hypothetical protein